MNVISYRTIREFVESYPDAEPALKAWYDMAKKARWRSLAEVRQVYPHADLVGERTVFNIKGNNYRLIVYINYEYQTIYIKAVLTHAGYNQDKWKT